VSSVKDTSGFHKEILHFQSFLWLLKYVILFEKKGDFYTMSSVRSFVVYSFLCLSLPLFYSVWLLSALLCCFIPHCLFEVNCASDQVLEYNICSSCSYVDC